MNNKKTHNKILCHYKLSKQLIKYRNKTLTSRKSRLRYLWCIWGDRRFMSSIVVMYFYFSQLIYLFHSFINGVGSFSCRCFHVWLDAQHSQPLGLSFHFLLCIQSQTVANVQCTKNKTNNNMENIFISVCIFIIISSSIVDIHYTYGIIERTLKETAPCFQSWKLWNLVISSQGNKWTPGFGLEWWNKGKKKRRK